MLTRSSLNISKLEFLTEAIRKKLKLELIIIKADVNYVVELDNKANYYYENIPYELNHFIAEEIEMDLEYEKCDYSIRSENGNTEIIQKKGRMRRKRENKCPPTFNGHRRGGDLRKESKLSRIKIKKELFIVHIKWTMIILID
ncbi:hypothetical protein Glove_309g153 [Diversispora epigaea]|uniref:Uncharacterized protein n=1 Tax=Diversispora epigaea TaxID=1348612 RepID=A0A397HTD0_9GLOM|nr:hypothetical protein Glove_309g153 [Diversispora epigaea]